MEIPGLDKIAETHPEVYEATNLAKTVANMVAPDRERILERYKNANLAAYLLFERALGPDGKLDTSKAFISWNIIGKALTKNVNTAINYANQKLPFIDINVHFDSKVLSVDLSKPKMATLIVNEKGGKFCRHKFDKVFLENGTTSMSTVPKSIVPRTFSRIPNSATMKYFLYSLGLFGLNGKLKPGTKLGITSISTHDYVNILATFLGTMLHVTIIDHEKIYGKFINVKG